MLTSWLTLTAFLAASANPERAAITVAPTCRVKGHPEAELTLNCGDGKIAGVVQHWHTPFGDLQHRAAHSELDPVFMHSDGSLVVSNTSLLHSGLYYCLLQHTEGTTLWPYELHVGHNNQKNPEDSEYEQHRSSCGAFRFRRDIGSEAERQEGVSDEMFAGAVAASVLLTFAVGFSAGALSRTHVLRCLRAVTTRLPSPRKRRCQTASCDSEVNMTDLPPMCENQAFEADTSAHSATSSAPSKPQRSFRHKLQQQEEQQETTAYLEGCDHMTEERRGEEVAGGSLEEERDGVTEEEEELEERVFYLSGEDRGSQTETDEGECSEEGEERDRRESKEEERSEEGGDRRGSVEEVGANKEKGSDEKEGWREEKEVQEERNEQEGEDRRESVEEAEGNKEGGRDEKEEEVEEERNEQEGEDRRESVEEAGGNKEEGRDEREEEKEEGGDGETDSSSEDETGSQKQEDTIKSGTTEEEEPAESSAPRPARRSRVIRLYQYDDDGQRYSHLPEPAPVQPRPAPRQRSLSLTRLNAIMAAASAGPLDTKEGGKEERTHFHMEI